LEEVPFLHHTMQLIHPHNQKDSDEEDFSIFSRGGKKVPSKGKEEPLIMTMVTVNTVPLVRREQEESL
jgi:hypothetical protein